MNNKLYIYLQEGCRRVHSAVRVLLVPSSPTVSKTSPEPVATCIASAISSPPSAITPIATPESVVQDISAERKLDNRPWLSLMEELAALLNETDDSIVRMQEGQKPFACHIQTRIFEILERNGATEIGEAKEFDISKHKVVPACRVPAGVPIIEVLLPGLAIEEKVIRRAWVKI